MGGDTYRNESWRPLNTLQFNAKQPLLDKVECMLVGIVALWLFVLYRRFIKKQDCCCVDVPDQGTKKGMMRLHRMKVDLPMGLASLLIVIIESDLALGKGGMIPQFEFNGQ